MLMAVGLGAILPLQAAINGKLARTVNSPVVSAFVSFGIGTIALLLFLIATRQLQFHGANFQNTPWWIWTGGLLGTFFVAGIVVLLPKLGVALAFSLVLGGQMLAAIIFDHFGLLEVAVRQISPGKIIGVILLIAGVMLIRKY